MPRDVMPAMFALTALLLLVASAPVVAAANAVDDALLPTRTVWDPLEGERRDIRDYTYEELETIFSHARFGTYNDIGDVCGSVQLLWGRAPLRCSGYVPMVEPSVLQHRSLVPPTSRRSIDYAQVEFTIRPYDASEFDGLPADYPDKVLIEQPPRAKTMREDRYVYDRYRIDPFGYDEWNRPTGVRTTSSRLVVVEPAYPPWYYGTW